jgi:hypothetical protein
MNVRIFPDAQPEAAGLSMYTTLAWIDRRGWGGGAELSGSCR